MQQAKMKPNFISIFFFVFLQKNLISSRVISYKNPKVRLLFSLKMKDMNWVLKGFGV